MPRVRDFTCASAEEKPDTVRRTANPMLSVAARHARARRKEATGNRPRRMGRPKRFFAEQQAINRTQYAEHAKLDNEPTIRAATTELTSSCRRAGWIRGWEPGATCLPGFISTVQPNGPHSNDSTRV
ncbi:unnamed protein product, partial [Iphiclides podalirius]